MPVIPSDREGAIVFCEQHVPVWTAAPTLIGLTAAQCTSLDNATKAARLGLNVALAARQTSKTRTSDYYNLTGTMRNLAADLVRAIKNFAELNNNPNVYTLAQIPPPAAPTTNPPPGQPNSFKVELEATGAVTLRWKSTNSSSSSGSLFTVVRRIGSDPAAPFTNIGGTSSKVFTDDTLPLGTMTATYLVIPSRNGDVGTSSDQLTVQFGVGAGGGQQVLSVTGGGMGMAA